jgi:hypothetical protein
MAKRIVEPAARIPTGPDARRNAALAAARRVFASEPVRVGNPMREGFEVDLQTHRIDTGVASSQGSSPKARDFDAGKVFDASSQRMGTRQARPFIVQFSGPIREAWKQALAGAGVVIRDYVPNNAFVVEATRATLARVAAVPEVQWVGEYRPEYKIQPFLGALAAVAEGRRPDQKIEIAAADIPAVMTVTISTFAPEDAEEAAAEVSRLGGQVLSRVEGRRCGRVRARVPLSAVSALAALASISWIEEYVEPRILNDYAVQGHHMNVTNLWAVHGLSGSNQIVGHADTGLDIGDTNGIHPDFANKIVLAVGLGLGRAGKWDDPDGHGTHTAGSILGSGAASTGQFRGVAFGARIVHQSVIDRLGSLSGIPGDLNVLFHQTYTNGARVHSDSWGAAVAGRYDSEAQDCDQHTWDYPDMLLVFAAGNDGVDGNSDGVVDLDSMGSPGTAKNILTVGASENGRSPGSGGYSSYTYGGGWPSDYPVSPVFGDYISSSPGTNPQGMAAFSSRGPTDDGRIKPDITAPGTDVVSCRSRHPKAGVGWGAHPNTNYCFSGGTSMATPLTAGAAALVRQFCTDVRKLTNPPPTAALLKATMINGARSLTPGQYGTGAAREIPDFPRPNNVEGWGQVDLEDTLFPAAPRQLFSFDREEVSTGQTNEYALTVTGTNKLCVTLAYSDYPGSLSGGRNLVNDLDLVLIGPGSGTHYPNGLSAEDRFNNVEGIDLLSPTPGDYTIRVVGYNTPYGPQPYALVISGAASLNTSGYLSLESAAFAVAENAGSLPIRVIRHGGSSGAVSASWATGDGTAVGGFDFTAATGTVALGDGVISNQFAVTILNDGDDETNEVFAIRLFNPVNAGLHSPSNAVVTILDDDGPGSFAFAAVSNSAAEAAGAAEIAVLRLWGSQGAVTVNYSTSNGTATAGVDYTNATGTLVFAAGVTSNSFTVPIVDDLTNELDETVNLYLSGPTGGATLADPHKAVLTIMNDDKPTNVVFQESFDGGLPAGWTVKTNGSPAGYWRFDDPGARGNKTGGTGAFAIADSDYIGRALMDTELRTPVLDFSNLETVMLEFKMDFRWYSGGSNEVAEVGVSTHGAAGPWVTVGRVLGMNLRGPRTITTNITSIAAGQANVMIRFWYYRAYYDYWFQVDDVAIYGVPKPVVSAGSLRFNSASYSVSESGTNAAITVIRTGGSDGEVSVGYRTSDGTATAGSDYTTATGTLTFAAGVTTNGFVVPILGDGGTESNETVNLLLFNPAGGAVLAEPTNAVLTIVDDDAVYHAALGESFDAGAPAGWTVTADGDPNARWRFDDPGSRTNQTGGTGGFAIADSLFYNYTNMDTSLISPALNLSVYETVALQYKLDFWWYRWDQDEIADVDVSTNGLAGPWVNAARLQGAEARGPLTTNLDLTALAAGRPDVRIRFRYHQAYHEYWWQVDDVAVSGALVGGNADRDGDGLQDWWEDVYFGGPTNAPADGDPDGDGFSNWSEYVAGTDPTNPASFFKIADLDLGLGREVYFNSLTDRLYRMWFSTNLTTPGWLQGTNVPGQGGAMFIADTNSLPARYYRIEVTKP